jgi:hypothetical protein
MDTLWFAIDKNGHVAMLDSSEGGAVPMEWDHDEGAAYDQLEQLAVKLGGQAPDDYDPRLLAEKCGLFLYEGPGGNAEPYDRAIVPKKPLAATSIPELAKQWPRFEGSFADHERLQPAEHWKEIVSWSASWVGTDGTLRCVPGREDEYPEEYEALKDDYPKAEPPKRK